MVISMYLAHLVGDYILQWDSLAAWKSRNIQGVAAHCLIVSFVTLLFALPFNPFWWQGVLFISVAHFLIDAVQLYIKPPIPALARFTLDQIAHFIVITLALGWSGYLNLNHAVASFAGLVQSERVLLLLLGYAFITMPAWVVVKFAAYGLVAGAPPRFPGETNKYIGILERVLMTTFVMMGQFLLVPLVAMPRLALEWPDVPQREGTAVYVAELLASICLAVATGLVLRQL